MNIGKNIGVSVWGSQYMPALLESIPDPESLILFCMYEFQYNGVGTTPGFEGLVDFANEKEIPFFIVSGANARNQLFHDPSNPRYARIQPIIYWDNFWMGKAYMQLEPNNDVCNIHNFYEGTDVTEYDYLYISMNAKTHVHRCVLLDCIARMNLFERAAISFRYEEDDTLATRTNFYKFKYWNPKRLDLDDTGDGPFTKQGKIPIEYKRSFMQIVSESNHLNYFLTEKTCAPLYFNKPFLVSGIKGFHAMLESMGFKLYNEIFDYSFDKIDNLEVRNHLMLQNVLRLSKLSNSDLRQLYIKIAPKLLYNRHLIQDLALNPLYVPGFIKHLWNFQDPCLNPDNGIFYGYLQKILGQKD